MHSLRTALFVACMAAGGLTGCGAQYVTRGADLYANGYYVEAAEVFERTERRLDRLSAADRARYGLYRGATLLALGDSGHAERWLRYSETIARADHGALTADEHVMLERAVRVLTAEQPAGIPLGDGSAVASSQSQTPGTAQTTTPAD